MRCILALLIFLLAGCGLGAAVPRRTARTNVLLSGPAPRGVDRDLERIFAPYDIAFWAQSDRERVDGITVFFETSSPEEWGAGPKTVGYSPERCAPEVRDGVIVGAAAVFCSGAPEGNSGASSAYCAGVVAHEIGHLLGLEHVLRQDDLMHAIYRGPVPFGHFPVSVDEDRCRVEQDDSALLLAALGARAD